jgi:hypothetical protein
MGSSPLFPLQLTVAAAGLAWRALCRCFGLTDGLDVALGRDLVSLTAAGLLAMPTASCWPSGRAGAWVLLVPDPGAAGEVKSAIP